MTLSASIFDVLNSNGKAVGNFANVVEGEKISLAEKVAKTFARQLRMDSRRTCRLRLAAAESERNTLIHNLVSNPDKVKDYQLALKNLAAEINSLKLALTS